MVAVHLIREYCRPRETFVVNQIATLERYKPVVLCRRQLRESLSDRVPVVSVESILRPSQLWAEDFCYKYLRILTPVAAQRLASSPALASGDILHFHFLVDARFFLSVTRRVRVPKIVSVYGYDVSCFPREYHGLGLRYLKPMFAAMDLFLAMSEDMKKDLMALGVPEAKIKVHYHGVRVDRFAFPGRTYIAASTIRVLCVGFLEPKKGQHHLLKALKKLEQKRPDLDFNVTLVGDGPLRRELEDIVVRYAWTDKVRFTGHIPHEDPTLPEIYRKADVFVHYSTSQPDGDKEGIPGTIVEAMASGLPVISTFHGGIPEAIRSGVDGLLLPENDIGSLVIALERALTDSDLRARLGTSAAARAKTELNLVHKTRQLEDIYDSLSDT